MTIKTYGYKEIKNGIKNDISMAKYAYEVAQNDSCFLPIHFPELSIFCFKYKSKIKGISDSLINKKIIDMIEEDGDYSDADLLEMYGNWYYDSYNTDLSEGWQEGNR